MEASTTEWADVELPERGKDGRAIKLPYLKMKMIFSK